jgi:hypothetical protein
MYIKIDDIEEEDIIWVEKFNEYKLVSKIDINLNGDYIITFEDKTVVIYNQKSRVLLM